MWFNVFVFLSSHPCCVDETVTLSEVLERLSPYLAQIKVLHKVFCTGVAEVPPETPNVVRASHLLNTLYKAIIEYDSIGEASEQGVSRSQIEKKTQLVEKRRHLKVANNNNLIIELYVHFVTSHNCHSAKGAKDAVFLFLRQIHWLDLDDDFPLKKKNTQYSVMFILC